MRYNSEFLQPSVKHGGGSGFWSKLMEPQPCRRKERLEFDPRCNKIRKVCDCKQLNFSAWLCFSRMCANKPTLLSPSVSKVLCTIKSCWINRCFPAPFYLLEVRCPQAKRLIVLLRCAGKHEESSAFPFLWALPASLWSAIMFAAESPIRTNIHIAIKNRWD